MADPLRRWKYQPWRALLQVSGLTILIVLFLELLLSVSGRYRVLLTLYRPPFGTIISFTTAVGVGAFAVYLLERFYHRVFLTTSSLWALVPCLALVIFLKSLLPVDPLIVQLSYLHLIGVIVGVFWKGRPYWR